MERIQHYLEQNTPPWDAFRLEHDGASETAATLCLHKNVTRSELMHAKHTGLPKEFSEFVQTRILDRGHEIEGPTRQMVEQAYDIELYPQVWSYGRLSVSTDGLTMDCVISCEIKQWNEALAASVARGELPVEHQPQCQQNLYVTGAEKLIFAVSDGTPDKFVHMIVMPDKAWQDRIVAAWKQFHEDLKTYTPPEVLPPVAVVPMLALPAVSINVEGKIALISNLDVFGRELRAFITQIPADPQTDEEFAQCKAACRALKTAEDALDAAEAHAMGQIAAFDEMRRTKELLFNLARDTRLQKEKLVVAQERARKEKIVAEGRAGFIAHMASLNKRIGSNYMPPIPENFGGAVKGLKSLSSFKEAVNNELVRLKLESNAIADKIQVNVATLAQYPDHAFLFADTAQIVLKNPDDFTALVKLRISEHKEAEAKREEAQREKIRVEEERKAQAAADKRIAEDRAQQEATAKIEARKIADAAAAERQQVIAHATEVSAPTPAVTQAPMQAVTPKPRVGITTKGPRPSDDDMIEVLALHYRVHESKVIEWLLAADLRAASQRMTKEFAA